MKNGQVVLVCDFDGTICEHKFPEIGEVKPNAIKVLQALDEAGFKIVIHTCRATSGILGKESSDRYIQEMEDWLKKNKIPYDEVWRGIGKPAGHIYIDDHALPFTGWTNTFEMLLKMVNYVKAGKATLPITEGEKQ